MFRAFASQFGRASQVICTSTTRAAFTSVVTPANSQPPLRWSTVGKRVLAAGGAAGVGAAVAYNFRSFDDVKLLVTAPTRFGRDVVVAASIVWDYRRSLEGLTGDERLAELHKCHQRGADSLLWLALTNQGVYIKVGQHLAQLDHLLPIEYVLTMRNSLLDKCPISSYPEVRQIIYEDLGKQPEELFASFDPVPVASASLAQVHVATGFDGSKLAVKVQHAGLRESAKADIATVSFLVHTVKWLYPDYDYTWLIDEIKDNLPKELDFKQEAANAERCRAYVNSCSLKHRVYVPRIDHNLVTHRVLTMEFIDAVGVTDVLALRKLGIKPAELAALVSETFNQMIFRWGFVHCDPHAANLLARTQRNGKMQLVLLDHGLYREFSNEFRREYAGLWRALILGDVNGIRRHSQAMNAGDLYQLFSVMLTQRPWEQVIEQSADHLSVPASPAARENAAKFASKYARDISTLLLRIPRPLLLLLKTNDCLRSVDMALGTPVNTFVSTARACTHTLAEQRWQERPGLRSWLVGWVEIARVETRLLGLNMAMKLARWRAAFQRKGAHVIVSGTGGVSGTPAVVVASG